MLFSSSNIVRRIAPALLSALISTQAALADDTPAVLSGAKIVTAEEAVKAMRGGAVVIDTRIASEYADGQDRGRGHTSYRQSAA